MAHPVQPRLPWAPLESVLLARLGATERLARSERNYVTTKGAVTDMAALCETTSRSFHRYMTDESLPLYSADAAACALGLHPSLIWGDDWWRASGGDGWSDMLFARLREETAA
jgi:hypothetical protein